VSARGPEKRLLTPEEALGRVLDGVVALPAEPVALDAVAARILAAPAVARFTLPRWDNSAMDGFAVRATDVASASETRPVILPVSGEVAAGHAAAQPMVPGTALRITTGAMLPTGADTVVPVEDTDALPSDAALPSRVAIRRAAVHGAWVRRTGEDVTAGMEILPAGRLVGPAALALLAAAGVDSVLAHRRPRLAVIATGDELATVGGPLGPAQIYDSNTVALVAQARACGAEARGLGIAPDDLAKMRALLVEAAADADVVVVSGGVSVGAHDVVKSAFAALGRIDFWRVAMQPGRPMAYGRIEREGRPLVALFGLPGNPVSAFVTFELFVRPLVRRLAGHPDGPARPTVWARLLEPVSKDPARRAYLRVVVMPDGRRRNAFVARLAGGQGSHVLSALAAANGLAIVPEGLPGLPAGAEVEVLQLDEEGA